MNFNDNYLDEFDLNDNNDIINYNSNYKFINYKLNHNSHEFDIIFYIENDAPDFIGSYFNETWAKPYLEKAIKLIIKDDAFFFLYCYSDLLWAQPYLDEAVKKAAEVNPEYFMKTFADRFPHGIKWALFALGGENASK